MDQYSSEALRRINADPLYRDFLDFKDEALQKSSDAVKKMMQEDENDMYQYQSQFDAYFGDLNGGDWSTTPLNWNMAPTKLGSQPAQQPMQHIPSFYIL